MKMSKTVLLKDLRLVDLSKVKDVGILVTLTDKVKDRTRLSDIRKFFSEPSAESKKVMREKGWID